MTLSTTANRISYAGDGSTVLFSFPYYFLADGDLQVILTVDATGVETIKTITTHYSVSGSGVAAGGSVTMVTAPAVGETLTIYRNPAITQGVDFVENDPEPAETLEMAFDRLTMIAQTAQDQLDNSLKLPTGENADMTLPTEVDRASKFLAFDSSGMPIAADSVAGSIVVSAFMQTVLDDTTAAAARTTLGFSGASGTVATANIEDGAVTKAKLANAAMNFTVLSKTTGYTILGTDDLVIANTSGGGFTLTFPAASSNSGKKITIKKTGTDYNTLTLARAGSDLIEGETSQAITAPTSCYDFFSDGSSNWYVK